jgi:hypothetical protein
MRRVAIAVALLVVSAVTTFANSKNSGTRSIEQKLAGLMVGVDTRATIRSRFGPLRNDKGQDYVRVGNNCELRFVFSDADAKRIKPNATLTVIVLQRVQPDSTDSTCDTLATGMGLRFGDSPDRLQEVYGRPEIHLDESEIVFVRYTNYNECGQDRKKAINAKDLMVRWKRSTRRIVEINVQGQPTSCDLILAE